MIVLRRCWSVWCVLICAVVTGTGCRDSEPPPAHNRDLGIGDVVLLPTASVRHDTRIADGQADWPAFRKPEFGSAPADDEVDEPDGHEEGDSTEAEIRELIDEYNEVVADGTVEELLDYYVEAQHDKLQGLFEAARALAAKLAELRQELETKMPDAAERIASSFASLAGSTDIRLVVDSLSVVSDTEVTGTRSGGSVASTLRFVLVREEDEDGEESEAWYIEVPAIDELAIPPKPVSDLTRVADSWLQALQSGQTPPESVLQQVEAAAAAAAAPEAQGEDRQGDVDQPGTPEEPSEPQDAGQGG